MRAEAIPSIISVAGPRAEAAYRAYLDNTYLSAKTRRNYRSSSDIFFRWAKARGLSLRAIDADALTAFAAEVAATRSPHVASLYLVPVRGVLRTLVAAGVLADAPWASARSARRRPARAHAEPRISLPELKEAVHELGDWKEDSRLFQAGLVVLAPVSIGTTDPGSVAAFTGVPEALVREYAAPLLASGVWRPDGKLDVWGADAGATTLSDLEITEVFFDVHIAVGHRPEGVPDAGGAPASGTLEISDDR